MEQIRPACIYRFEDINTPLLFRDTPKTHLAFRRVDHVVDCCLWNVVLLFLCSCEKLSNIWVHTAACTDPPHPIDAQWVTCRSWKNWGIFSCQEECEENCAEIFLQVPLFVWLISGEPTDKVLCSFVQCLCIYAQKNIFP